VITATHSHSLETAHATLAGYERVRVVADQEGLRLTTVQS
jgi:hypothetical protein